MLKLSDELVLFGFEAEDYYTGNFEEDKCLVRKEDFDHIAKFVNIPEDLDIYEFDDLDGKHAHVEGDYVEETMTVEQFIKRDYDFPYQLCVQDAFPESDDTNNKIDIFSNEYNQQLENEINELRKDVIIKFNIIICATADKRQEVLDFIESLK